MNKMGLGMRKIVLLLAALVATASPLLLQTAPARAQVPRTWVSGTGDDSNTVSQCQPSAPCLSFSAALQQTQVGGEINCFAPNGLNGYGAPLEISASITIDCHSVYGSLGVNGTNGIVINAPGAVVNLRNLNFDGFSVASEAAGLNAITIEAAALVNIEDCMIENFSQSGISVTTSANTVVNIRNTSIKNVANGISLAPSGGAVNGSIDHTLIAKTSGDGITTNTGSVFFTVTNSLIVNAAGIGVHSGGTGTVLGVASSSVTNNNTAFATSGGTIRISRNEIYDNNTNFSISGGTIATSGNNDVAVNGSTVPNGTITQQ
jgi:hypothetical protein